MTLLEFIAFHAPRYITPDARERLVAQISTPGSVTRTLFFLGERWAETRMRQVLRPFYSRLRTRGPRR